jgi:AraC-like DNA-binding protein
MTHYLEKVVKEVNKTHLGLGEQCAAELLAYRAAIAVINVGVRGTGKSAGSNAVANAVNSDKVMLFDSFTRSGLKDIQDDLTGYDGLIIMDDLAKIDTIYSRIAMTTTLAELTYSGFIRKLTVALNIDVHSFTGGAIMNCQPVVLNSIVVDDAWEGSIADKTLRLYHLFRPITPRTQPPNIPKPNSMNKDMVNKPNIRSKEWTELTKLLECEWSKGRVLEHGLNLLKAAASFDGRKKVIKSDYAIIRRLLKTMKLEKELVTKAGLETDRNFANNLHCVLTEINTYGNPTLKQIAQNYKCSERTVERVVGNLTNYCYFVSVKRKVRGKTKNVRILRATEKTRKILSGVIE